MWYRPLEVLEDGDFLIAHFASKNYPIYIVIELTANKKKDICKKDFE